MFVAFCSYYINTFFTATEESGGNDHIHVSSKSFGNGMSRMQRTQHEMSCSLHFARIILNPRRTTPIKNTLFTVTEESGGNHHIHVWSKAFGIGMLRMQRTRHDMSCSLQFSRIILHRLRTTSTNIPILSSSHRLGTSRWKRTPPRPRRTLNLKLHHP
jgi:hypothetical protein